MDPRSESRVTDNPRPDVSTASILHQAGTSNEMPSHFHQNEARKVSFPNMIVCRRSSEVDGCRFKAPIELSPSSASPAIGSAMHPSNGNGSSVSSPVKGTSEEIDKTNKARVQIHVAPVSIPNVVAVIRGQGLVVQNGQRSLGLPPNQTMPTQGTPATSRIPSGLPSVVSATATQPLPQDKRESPSVSVNQGRPLQGSPSMTMPSRKRPSTDKNTEQNPNKRPRLFNDHQASASSASSNRAPQNVPSGGMNNATKRPHAGRSDHSSPRKRRRVSAMEDNAVQSMQGPINDVEDSRFANPRSWEEVQTLQQALAPTYRTFATTSGRVTEKRPPPKISPWNSYADHYRVLQQAMMDAWQSDHRIGAPPELAGLCAWTGGINAWHKAKVRTTEEALNTFIHPRLRPSQPPQGSLLWHEERAWSFMNRHAEAKRRQEMVEAQRRKSAETQRQLANARLRADALAAEVREDQQAQRQARIARLQSELINTHANADN